MSVSPNVSLMLFRLEFDANRCSGYSHDSITPAADYYLLPLSSPEISNPRGTSTVISSPKSLRPPFSKITPETAHQLLEAHSTRNHFKSWVKQTLKLHSDPTIRQECAQALSQIIGPEKYEQWSDQFTTTKSSNGFSNRHGEWACSWVKDNEKVQTVEFRLGMKNFHGFMDNVANLIQGATKANASDPTLIQGEHGHKIEYSTLQASETPEDWCKDSITIYPAIVHISANQLSSALTTTATTS